VITYPPDGTLACRVEPTGNRALIAGLRGDNVRATEADGQVALMDRTGEPISGDHVFVLPLAAHYLLYAPLHHLAALVDRRAVRQLQDWLLAPAAPPAGLLADIARTLAAPAEPAPQPRQGDFLPAFLGLIPTRGCNLACQYCGFLAPGGAEQIMDLALARDAIAWYLGLVARAGQRAAEVHFFGGEPFCAEEVIDFAYHSARLAAAEAGCTIRFEVATNGTFGQERCRWVADSLDSVILSLDGPADIHDRQRPRQGGQGSLDAVLRSARILSTGAAELSFRVCVTADTVTRMPDIAAWLCRDFRPVSVCFEPVQPSAPSEAAGLCPPDPWAFAWGYFQAADILEAHGVEPVYAAADIRTRRASFCPVGQDVAIVSPDGAVAACYLLPQDWEARELDLTLGHIEAGSARLDAGRIAAARDLSVWSKPLCARCFCRWHCAGGCHVNHALSTTPGDYDRLCLQTRLIALRNLLHTLDRDDLLRDLFRERQALEAMARRPSDAIADLEVAA
jgi:uncharacterized protein